MSMLYKQLPNLLVPSASYDLVDAPFTSLVESDSKGSYCMYHKGDGKTKSTRVRKSHPSRVLLNERNDNAKNKQEI